MINYWAHWNSCIPDTRSTYLAWNYSLGVCNYPQRKSCYSFFLVWMLQGSAIITSWRKYRWRWLWLSFTKHKSTVWDWKKQTHLLFYHYCLDGTESKRSYSFITTVYILVYYFQSLWSICILPFLTCSMKIAKFGCYLFIYLFIHLLDLVGLWCSPDLEGLFQEQRQALLELLSV